MSDWSWDNLKYLLAIAEHGTMTEAAKQLGVSHTTVQRRITTFEVELKTALLSKNHDGYTLTDAGQALYHHACNIRQALETETRVISALDSEIRGPITITSTDTISFFLLPDILKRLCERYPDLDIHLSMKNRLSDIQNLEADIAIRTCREPPEQLIGRKIGSVGFKICATKDYLRQHRLRSFPIEGSDHSVIILDATFDGAPFHDWFRERISSTAKTITVNGFLAAWSLCKKGMGIALLPGYLANESGELVALETDQLPESNDLWILGHSDFRDTERVRVVRHFLFDELQKIFAP